MFEQSRRFEASPGNFTEKLIYKTTVNFTKGEEIEYVYRFDTQIEYCNTTVVA